MLGDVSLGFSDEQEKSQKTRIINNQSMGTVAATATAMRKHADG